MTRATSTPRKDFQLPFLRFFPFRSSGGALFGTLGLISAISASAAISPLDRFEALLSLDWLARPWSNDSRGRPGSSPPVHSYCSGSLHTSCHLKLQYSQYS